MTVLEAIQSNPVFGNLPPNTIQFAMESRAVNGSATHSESSLKDVELVSADLYMMIVVTPEFKEGQLSIKYDTNTLKNRAKTIYQKYDDAKLKEFELKTIDVGISAV